MQHFANQPFISDEQILQKLVTKKYMGNCSCFYAQKLQKYKDLYPLSSKLQSNDPRVKDPEFLREQIKKLDYIIQHQNIDLARLQHENDKLRESPRGKNKVLNNAKKLFLMTKNGMLCKYCLQQNDTNKVPAEKLVHVEGLCGQCKGDGLKRQYAHVKSKQCGLCDKFYQNLWRIQLCSLCSGQGMFHSQGASPYAMKQDTRGQVTTQQLVKQY